MITFAQLRRANTNRLPQFKNARGELAHSEPDGSDWCPAQWLQAVVGEVGEYANLRKKFERGDVGHDFFMAEAADELADIVIYLDILAKQLGIDLGEAVCHKFNKVSRRIESDVLLHSLMPKVYLSITQAQLKIPHEPRGAVSLHLEKTKALIDQMGDMRRGVRAEGWVGG